MIYAASVVIIDELTNEVDTHLFTFTLKSDATTTPLEMAKEIACSLLPQDRPFDCQFKVMPVDFNRHLEQYILAEMQG